MTAPTGIGAVALAPTTVALATLSANAAKDAAWNLNQIVSKISSGGSESSEGESKAVPNPNGKNGSPLHQGKIQETADNLKSQGYDVSFEKYVKTEGGFKSSRYGDILATDPKTGEQFIIQVGKQTKAGNPISRENKAIQDLTKAGWKVEFVPYN